jgi:S1-C subfamily serine protease
MDLNGETNTKRKRSSIAAPGERPTKHLKPESSTLTPGDATPANGTVYDVEDEEDTGRVMPIGPAQADSPEWQATIEKVVKSVVSIHFCQTCSFDTDLSMSSQATGFVVDAERGYILTNRHVVCAGPFWGYCIFDNHEEVRRVSGVEHTDMVAVLTMLTWVI